MQPGLLIPVCKLRSPIHQMGPHQIAELTDLKLRIELGAQIKKMQERPQGETHHKMLAVIKRKDAAGMLFCETGS